MQDGDFLRMEYVGRIASTGEVFDLTDEALAKKEGIHDPKVTYGPVLVIVGSGMAVPGVEKQLREMKPGEEREFPVSQEDGFGKRDPRLIKIISLQKFYSQKINPVPGIFVNIDGRHAKVQSVSGGRVRVDFNSPLAGKDLKYWVKVTEKIEGPENQAIALLKHYNMSADVSFYSDSGKLTITTGAKVPDQLQAMLNRQITKWVKGVKEVSYQEKPKSPAQKAEASAAPAQKAEKPGESPAKRAEASEKPAQKASEKEREKPRESPRGEGQPGAKNQ